MEQPDRARDLPEEFALPLASGAEWWYWLGGRPAPHLVNTLRERWPRRLETLVTPHAGGQLAGARHPGAAARRA